MSFRNLDNPDNSIMASKPASTIPLPNPESETREAYHKRITKALLRYALKKVRSTSNSKPEIKT